MNKDLDLNVCIRQQLGSSYEPSELSQARAQQLLQGTLRLPPHPDWKGDLENWQEDPYGDNNWRFQRHTFRWMMPLIHESDNRPEYCELFKNLVKAWLEAENEGKLTAREVWMDMTVGTRAITLSTGAFLFDKEDMSWYVPLLRRHRDWLADPRNLGRANHALHQHQGLFVVSSVLRDQAGQSLAISRITKQFTSAFDEEGMNDEGSASYHQLNMAWWKTAWDRLTVEGIAVPKSALQKLDLAGLVLAHMTLPSGTLLQFGDGAVTETRPGLSKYSDWLATRGQSGEADRDTFKVLKRGYVFSRTDWTEDATFFATRFGETRGTAHAHEDRGAIWLHSRKIHWVVDSGFSSYARDDLSMPYLRSGAAHNISFIEGVDLDETKPVELRQTKMEEGLYRDVLLYDQRFSPYTIERRITHLLEPDIVLVRDMVAKLPGEAPVLGQRWQIGAGIRTWFTDRGYFLQCGETTAHLQWLGRRTTFSAHKAVRDSNEGWIYPRWRTPNASTQITAHTSNGSTLVALFAPNSPNDLGLIRSYVDKSGTIRLVASRGPLLWDVTVGDEITVTPLERDWNLPNVRK